MIAQDRLTEVISSQVAKEFLFSLSEKGLATIFDILRNQLYSNKVLAVIREVSSNAFDAMAEVGKGSEPFKVFLPTHEEPVFKVRDFGRGLSQEEVRDVFISYGASTKTSSNLFIGQKGIGAKSPFAYGDNFMVVSYRNGMKCCYNAYIDPSQIGKMAVLSENEETSEPDGLEVIVPIRDEDVSKFQEEGARFFKYWKVAPVFEGYVPRVNFPPVLFQGKDWTLYGKMDDGYSYEEPVVIMGNVSYPIDQRALDWTGQDLDVKTLLHVGINFTVNIGDIEVSASRESIQYTALTQAAIFSKLKEIKEELVSRVDKDMGSCETMYEAKKCYRKIFDLASPLYILRALFAQSVSFKGIKVYSGDWSEDSVAMGASVKHFIPANAKRRKASFSVTQKIPASNDVLIVFNDINSGFALLSRLAPVLEGENNVLKKSFKDIRLITIHNDEAWKKWRQEEHFDAPIINLSSLPKIKLKNIYPNIYQRYSSGDSRAPVCNVFLWREDVAQDGYSSYSRRRRERDNHRKYWRPYVKLDDDKSESVFVEVSDFTYKALDGSWQPPQNLAVLKSHCEAAGITWPKVLGVKTQVIQKGSFCNNMVSLWQFLKAQVEKFSDLDVCLQRKANWDAFVATDDFTHKRMLDDCARLSLPDGFLKSFHQTLTNVELSSKEKAILALAYSSGTSNNYRANIDFKQGFVQVRQKYGMLFLTDFYKLHNDNAKAEIKKYIEFVEKNS